VSLLTLVGGKVVFGDGPFAKHDEAPPPPAMPDWSPVRAFGGYARSADPASRQALARRATNACGCARACGVHGHDHARAWTGAIPARDLTAFWGALGCACWAI